MGARTQAAVVLMVAALAGCRKDLTAPQASDLVKNAEAFTDAAKHALTLHKNYVFSKSELCKEHPDLCTFEALGLVGFRTYLGPAGAVSFLTPEGLEAAREWEPTGPDSWRVPIAQRELLEVVATKTEGDGARADFRWKWVRNRVGEALNQPDAREHTSQASFERYDKGQWRLRRIRWSAE
jgi:hypothetical protein